MKKYSFKVCNVEKPTTVKDYLKSIKISNQVIKDLSKQMGLIKVNGIDKRTIDEVLCGDFLDLTIIETENNQIIPVKHNLNIVYEDEYFLIVYKPYGISTIPSKGNYNTSLANYVCNYMLNKQPDFLFRAINRLDKDAQGFVVIALDKLIYSLLKDNIQKFYTCFCIGKLEVKQINNAIATIKDSNGKNQIKREILTSGKPSLTNIISVEYNKEKDISKAKIFITTGRTHQIRLHLSSIGHAIIGDNLYGSKSEKPLQLYCNEIFIFHPIKHKTLHFIIDVKNELIWN